MRYIKQILSLLFAFAPWIAFLILAGPSLPRLKIAVIVSSLITIVMWAGKFHRGIILWAGVIFFSWALVAVVGLEHMWTIRHLGVLSNGALAAGTIISVLIKNPFTLEYAKEKTPPERWSSPLFIRTNYIITEVWGVVFLMNVLLNYLKMNAPHTDKWVYEVVSYSFMLAAVLFTTFYAELTKSRAESL
jgi:hypothetical protein